MTASVCIVEINPASNCEGARYTPFSNIFWKNFPNRTLSALWTVFQSTGFDSLKNNVRIVPTRVWVTGTPAFFAADSMCAHRLPFGLLAVRMGSTGYSTFNTARKAS